MKIQGNTFIVTGGASGLGESVVRRLIKDGGNVAIFDLDEKNGTKLAGEFKDQALFAKVNVTSEESVQKAVNDTVEKFKAIHGVIQCAGVALPKRVISAKGQLHDIKSFNLVQQINVIGTFNVLRFAAEKMLANEPQDGEKGVFVHTASVAAFEGQIGQAAYSASKGAVVAMTLPIAREFAERQIRVNTVAPGIMDTPMMAGLPEKARNSLITQVPHPRRFGRPSEFADLCVHLVENSYINGTVVRLDGCIRMAAM